MQLNILLIKDVDMATQVSTSILRASSSFGLDAFVTAYTHKLQSVCRASIAFSITRTLNRLMAARTELVDAIRVKLKQSGVKKFFSAHYLKRQLQRIEREIQSWIESSFDRYVKAVA